MVGADDEADRDEQAAAAQHAPPALAREQTDGGAERGQHDTDDETGAELGVVEEVVHRCRDHAEVTPDSAAACSRACSRAMRSIARRVECATCSRYAVGKVPRYSARFCGGWCGTPRIARYSVCISSHVNRREVAAPP